MTTDHDRDAELADHIASEHFDAVKAVALAADFLFEGQTAKH